MATRRRRIAPPTAPGEPTLKGAGRKISPGPIAGVPLSKFSDSSAFTATVAIVHRDPPIRCAAFAAAAKG